MLLLLMLVLRSSLILMYLLHRRISHLWQTLRRHRSGSSVLPRMSSLARDALEEALEESGVHGGSVRVVH